MDVTESISFVEANGTDLETARLRCILYGTAPGPEALEPFLALQHPDGGFPFRMEQGNPTALNPTQVALLWMDELGMLDSSAAHSAFEYLLRSQREDGGWDEEAAIAAYDPPPWAAPGELNARIYLTAQSAFWLAAGGYGNHPGFPHALEFLIKYQDESGRFQGFPHNTWIATSVFWMAGAPYNETARMGMEALAAKPLADWVDSQIAWALDCLGRTGLPKEDPFVEAGLAELMRRRGAEGKWISEDGEARTVGAVIEALKVLNRYDLLELN